MRHATSYTFRIGPLRSANAVRAGLMHDEGGTESDEFLAQSLTEE